MPYFKYSDSIFLFYLTLITNKVHRKRKLQITGEKKFIEDNLKTFGNIDLLKRESFANEITAYINGTKTDNSFAIGIVGKWGTGKTVFLKFIEDKLKTNESLIIRFNPWRSKTPSIILEDFFSSFTNELKEYDPKISNQLSEYASALKELDENVFTKFIKYFSKIFSNNESIENKYSQLEESLKYLDKRIVIFIDDVDRLNEDEVFEILRIVRNAANFPNTFFLVAYDKNYVLSTIKKRNSSNSENFLEKIFQLEIQLPYYPESIVYSALLSQLKKDRSISDIQELENTLSESAISNFIMQYIINLRDVVRFVNSFNINYNFAKSGEVELSDFIILEMIKVKFINVYNFLSEKKFIESDAIFISSSKYKFNRTDASGYLKSNHEDLHISQDKIELILSSLDYLFNGERVRNLRSIIYAENFLLYFSPELFDKISFKEFKNLRNEDIQAFFKKLDQWIEEGKQDDIINLFFKTSEFENRQDFESFVKSMVYLNKLQVENWKADLFNKLSNVQIIVSRYYEKDIQKYKQFLLSIFNEAKYPYVFEASIAFDFLYAVLTDRLPASAIFTIEELNDLVFNFLRKYTEDENSRDVDFNAFRLYYNNYERIEGRQRSIILTDRANALFKKFIEKYPSGYIKLLIRPLYTPHDGETYTLEPFIPQTFNTYDAFEQFLNEQSETLDVLELKTFFRKFKLEKYEPIKFKRRTIEFISDKRTLFIESKQHPEIIKNVYCVTFEHGWMEKAIIPIYPHFTAIKWVAHENPINQKEGEEGGDYHLRRTFELNTSQNKINGHIEFFVDDFCTLLVNGKKILEKWVGGPDAKSESLINLKNGLNVVDFIIENKAGGGINNPYGIVYIIQFLIDE